MYTFDERLQRVYQRRNPWGISAAASWRAGANKSASIANESFAFDKAIESTSSIERMVVTAMRPVDPECVGNPKVVARYLMNILTDVLNLCFMG